MRGRKALATATSHTSSPRANVFLHSIALLSALVLATCANTAAQSVAVPRTGPTSGTAAQAMGIFDAQHLAERPYSGVLPPPIFPSSKRVQRLFTVAYAYDYAYSTYTPPATLPSVGRAAAKLDTPESAAIAYTSALRTGDLDALIAASDPDEAKRLRKQISDPAIGPAKLKAAFAQVFPGKTVELIARIEVAGYVILDVRSPGSSFPYLPLTFKLNNANWLFTNELAFSGSQFLANFSPTLAGVINPTQPQPVTSLNSPNLDQMVQAQGDFLREHLNRNVVTEAAGK